MSYELFSRVSLAIDLPEYGLKKGDIATVVDQQEGGPGQETGYSLEVFNAVGDTVAVVVVEESKIFPVHPNELLHVRQFDNISAT
jgi:hypothetical protein